MASTGGAGAAPILVLGGTGEAAELAGELAARGREVVMSFVGTTEPTDLPPVRPRIGAFGGVSGLVEELQRDGYGLLVDATHPFAARMAGNAATAADLAGVPHLRLLRPPWRARPGDRWLEVDDVASAARRLTDLGAQRAFLSVGRIGAEAFTGVSGLEMVLRSIQRPPALPLPEATVVLGRGPFTVDGELALFREHRIDVVVTRNSGGRATAAKLTAARRLGIPVVMIKRPESPAGAHATTVADALAWVESRLPAP